MTDGKYGSERDENLVDQYILTSFFSKLFLQLVGRFGPLFKLSRRGPEKS